MSFEMLNTGKEYINSCSIRVTSNVETHSDCSVSDIGRQTANFTSV